MFKTLPKSFSPNAAYFYMGFFDIFMDKSGEPLSPVVLFISSEKFFILRRYVSELFKF